MWNPRPPFQSVLRRSDFGAAFRCLALGRTILGAPLGRYMDQSTFSESVQRRFASALTTTVFAHVAATDPIAISRVISDPTWTERPPAEDAFTIHIQTGPETTGEVYMEGAPIGLATQYPSFVRILDLCCSPYAHITSSIDFLRINISRRALDEIAYDRGEKRISGFRTLINTSDQVLYGVGRSLISLFDFYGARDSLFLDHIGMAIYAYVSRVYGEVRSPSESRGGLAPWQLRRAQELMMANLSGDIKVSDLALACGLSTSHFAHAFRHTTGLPPHRWLMRERIRRAKSLIAKSQMALSDIAFACGFSDQSHLTRVFVSVEGQTPSRWRRLAQR